HNKDACQFYIILADSGMGKTTFLINLYLRYIDQCWGAKYQIKLFPLGWGREIDEHIENLPEKKNTILLLDAFDEDIQALDDYHARLRELVEKGKYFREVVITCRTQFFPTEEEEPKESGVLQFGGDGGDRIFRKLYLSPFDDKDISTYLRQRFAWFRRRKKQRAYQIVKHSPNLMVRPMLLSYIEDLLQSERSYTAPYQVYAELIQKWIEREAQKVPSDRRKHYEDDLFRFSREIARNIYENRQQRAGGLMIPGREIQPFAEKHNINLSEMEMKSRSLLNRNARGDYKFSHKSVLEYFLAEEALFSPDFRKMLDFEGMNMAESFLADMVLEHLTAPFFAQQEVSGEYSLNDGKIKILTKLNDSLLPQITYLKMDRWREEDDLLLFKGLKALKVLDISTPITGLQYRELHQWLPACQIFCYIADNEVLEAFGLTTGKVRIDDKDYNVWRPIAYITNQYEAQGNVVIDHATGLMWQKSGSEKYIDYPAARKYIQELNRKKFAGYEDWRLPTIPELMSLLEPEKQENGLYIKPIFDKNQTWCWSADLRQTKDEGSSGSAWGVGFNYGNVGWDGLDDYYYVRAVRSRQ
ncbi:MAG: DUF1566 domain-containing protein, partial [Syntrophaceae bacterium]|nr:DUF1566 domain-containing protein [Syntrophaceae bacterium]